MRGLHQETAYVVGGLKRGVSGTALVKRINQTEWARHEQRLRAVIQT
jgi:hypothetical protein